jgi:hypothetical protein
MAERSIKIRQGVYPTICAKHREVEGAVLCSGYGIYGFPSGLLSSSWYDPFRYVHRIRGIKIICRQSNLRCFLCSNIIFWGFNVCTRYGWLPSSGVEKSKELRANAFHIWKRTAITAAVNWTSVSSSTSNGSSRARGPVVYGHEAGALDVPIC